MQTLKMTFGYGSEQEATRNYSFQVEDSLAAACKNKIKAINASLAAGTDDGLADFFLDENGSDSFSKITHAELNSSVTEVLDISGQNQEG